MNSNYQPPILNIATHFSFSVAILFIFAGYTLEYPLLRDIGWIIILAVIVMCAARILLLLPAKVDLKISNITECIRKTLQRRFINQTFLVLFIPLFFGVIFYFTALLIIRFGYAEIVNDSGFVIFLFILCLIQWRHVSDTIDYLLQDIIFDQSARLENTKTIYPAIKLINWIFPAVSFCLLIGTLSFWGVQKPGSLFEKEDYSTEVNVRIQSQSNSLEVYYVKGHIDHTLGNNYQLNWIGWPNGGSTDFNEICQIAVGKASESCSDDEGRSWLITIQG